MSVHLLPVSPSLTVSVLGDGVSAVPGVLVGVRWDDETDVTTAAVLTEHGGIQWVEQAHVEAVRLS